MNTPTLYRARTHMRISRVIRRSAGKTLALTLLSIFATSALAGWERQWIDSFDGAGVDFDNNWTAQTQADYNNEVQCYTDDDSSAAKNYDVSDGTLKIIARKQSIDCPGLPGTRNWSSGRLNSKDKQEFLYGRIESRIRFSTLLGGTWPAFWMLENRIAEQPIAGDGDNVPWNGPGAGEIDVWEWFSNQPNSYITNFFNTSGCGDVQYHAYPGGAADVLEWHTYAIEWTADVISFYRDETQVATYNVTNCAQYKEPMFVLLNVAIGGNLGGAISGDLNEATMEVDYLAHCTSTDLNNETMCNEETPVSGGDDDGDGVGNNDDLCPNSLPGDTVDVDGCSLVVNNDNDGDGVNNNDDLCPNTTPGDAVDADGCSIVVSNNDAPEVRLVVMQDGQAGASIDPADGVVTITATVTDDNSADIHTLTWDLAGVPNAVEDGNTVSIDPAGLTAGNYTISVAVSDNGDPVLSDSVTVGFVVTTPDGTDPDPDPVVTPVATPSASSGGGGGAVGLPLLLMLGLLVLLGRMARLRERQS